MRALVVFAHPCPESFNAALRDQVVASLKGRGAEVRLLDLYADGFNPVMSAQERRDYHTPGVNEQPVRDHLDGLKWCDTLVFVYPTWWFAPPAMLKGWIERVFVPYVTFTIPNEKVAMGRANLHHITRLAVVTTCGATWWVSKLVGEPGRRIIMRGLRVLCAPTCRTLYLAHYQMDSSTPATRTRYLKSVATALRRF
ncbi:NAD(P)H-dependent oxidoreductase [Segnochrobactraceae bacterium EtOH-i3]